MKAAKRLVLSLIRGYQIFISPLMLPTCRYQPTCSVYAQEAIKRFGPWRGSRLAIRRVLRCHPFHPGGYDPVPRLLSQPSAPIAPEKIAGEREPKPDQPF